MKRLLTLIIIVALVIILVVVFGKKKDKSTIDTTRNNSVQHVNVIDEPSDGDFMKIIEEMQEGGEPETLTDRISDTAWIHAHEEDKNGLLIYKSKQSYDPPVSHYRHLFILHSRGDCFAFVEDPADKHHNEQVECKVKEKGDLGSLTIQDISYDIVSLSTDELQLRKK